MGALAGLFPGQVPAPLAVESERGWMVLADFGEEVGWEAPLEVVEEVAQTYARMQVEATGHVGRLLAAGCLDRRLDRLAAQAQAWLPAVEATAGLPGVDAATWLSPDEEAGLRAAVPGLQARCAELAGHAVPPALVHGDLHLSNVARRPGGYLFFDWTDACVATRSSIWPRSGGARPSSTPRTRASCGSGCGRPTSPSGPPSSRPGVWPGPGSWPPRWAPRTRRSAAGPWPPGRRETPTWPSRPPGGSARAGRPGVTDGTGGRCRTAQPGRRPPPQTAGRCTAERWGRWSWTRPRPRCRS
jgi:hypothetical protein